MQGFDSLGNRVIYHKVPQLFPPFLILKMALWTGIDFSFALLRGNINLQPPFPNPPPQSLSHFLSLSPSHSPTLTLPLSAPNFLIEIPWSPGDRHGAQCGTV